MTSVNDLHIMRYDQVFAKNGHVLLRYTAEGHFKGEPYMGVKPNGNHARWSAAAIFEVEDGKIKSFTKDWDQKVSKSMFQNSMTSPGIDVALSISADSAWMGSCRSERQPEMERAGFG